MKHYLILFLALRLCLSAAQAQNESWFPELEPIQANNASRLQPLAIFVDSYTPSFSPDGRYLAMGYSPNRILLFDTYTGQNQSYQGYQARFSQDSSLMAIGELTSRLIRIVDLEDRTINEITVPDTQCGFLYPEEFHPSNRFLLMSASDGADCNISNLIDLETGELASYYLGLNLNPRSIPGKHVEFSTNGEALIAQNYWDIRIFDTFSPDGNSIRARSTIASRCYEESIHLFEGFFASYDLQCELILIDPETDTVMRSFPAEYSFMPDPVLAYDDGILYIISDLYDEGARLSGFDFSTGERLTNTQLTSQFDFNKQVMVMNPTHDLVAGIHRQPLSEYDVLRPFGQLLLWNATTGEELPGVAFGAYTPVDKLWLNPEGTLLLTTGYVRYSYNVSMLWGIVEDSNYVPRLYGDVSNNAYGRTQTENPGFNPLFNLECPEAPPIQFTLGQPVFVPTAVEAGSNRNLRLRDAPNGEQTGSLLPGSFAVIVDGPVCGDDGLRWWGVASIEDPSLRGWAVDGFAPDDYLLLPRED